MDNFNKTIILGEISFFTPEYDDYISVSKKFNIQNEQFAIVTKLFSKIDIYDIQTFNKLLDLIELNNFSYIIIEDYLGDIIYK